MARTAVKTRSRHPPQQEPEPESDRTPSNYTRETLVEGTRVRMCGLPISETKNPRRARVSGRLWLDLLVVACPVARPRIARKMIRTAIIAVEGVAGGGTEAGHGWKLADGPDSRQDPCATPTHDGS